MKSIEEIIHTELNASDPRQAFDYDRDYYKADARRIAKQLKTTSTLDEVTAAIYSTFPGYFPPEDYGESGYLENLASVIHKAIRRK